MFPYDGHMQDDKKGDKYEKITNKTNDFWYGYGACDINNSSV